MVNAWSLLYEELNGTMDEVYPVMTDNTITPQESDEYDPIITTVGSGNTATYTVSDAGGADYLNFHMGNIGDITLNTDEIDQFDISVPDANLFASMDGVELPTPGIQKDCTRKYKEDESIEALKNYISTTYGGHYTSDNNNVQTLDLIESVGDAEAFCRSNAIKYLSRYDKKGQAKRDILKALHYSLLLYHFSGQLNETPTRGYETF